MTRRSFSFLLGLALLVVAVPAHAGQLHLEWYGLKSVAARGAYVAKVRIEAVDAKAGTLDVTVLETFAVPNQGKNVPQGRFVAKLYGGVEWTNPNKSPIDRRLAGSVRIGRLKAQAEVLLVPLSGGTALGKTTFEVVLWSSALERKVKLLFAAPERMAHYAKTAGDAELVVDLQDFDLFLDAYAALKQRKKLTARALLDAETKRLPEQPVAFHLKSLGTRQQRAFIDEMVALVQDNPELLERVFQRLQSAITPDNAAAVGPLFVQIDPASDVARDAAWALHSWVEKHNKPSHLVPFYVFVARYISQRPQDEKGQALAERFSKTLKGQPLTALGLALLSAAPRRTADGIEVLVPLVGYAANCAERAPSKAFTVLLGAIRPSGVKTTSEKATVLADVLRIAVAVGTKHKASRKGLARVVDVWLQTPRLDPPEALVTAWRKLVPAKER